MAGHSKWANIQHRKGRQDAVRSRLFSRISREITVAAKMGDADVDKNPRLRLAVKEAKTNSVPKDVIERAIKKSQNNDLADFDEVRYEGYAAGGVAIIVEALTDNRNRTASNVRSIFSKFGGNLGDSGSVSFLFDRLGMIAYPLASGDAEKIIEIAIEQGVDDVETTTDCHYFYCAPETLAETTSNLESVLGESDMAKLIWKPQNISFFDLEKTRKILNLVEALDDDEDVQLVTANFDISPTVMEQLK